MWCLIIRSYWVLINNKNKISQYFLTQKNKYNSLSKASKSHLSQTWLNQADQYFSYTFALIRVFIKILPLLGLLGTVDGMVESFQNMQQTNLQLHLAGGIYHALLTTLAGLVTALSGLYLIHDLQQRKNKYIHKLKIKLEITHALRP